MLFSVEQAFVGRQEIRAPLKTPAWEASALRDEEEIIIPQMQEATTQPSTFTNLSVYYLTLNGFKCREAPLREI